MGVEYPLAHMRLCYLSDVLVYTYHGMRLLLQYGSAGSVHLLVPVCRAPTVILICRAYNKAK